MAFSDLQTFIEALEAEGQLKRIAVEVDPELEVSEIANRVCKSASPEGIVGAPATDPVHGGLGGVALLFEKVRGSDVPLAINVYGSYERMRMALGGESFEALAQKIERLVKPEPPTSLMAKMKKLPELAKVAGYVPKRVKSGICQEVIHTEDADLLALPIIKCWPHDGGADSEVIVGRHRSVETSKRQDAETESDPQSSNSNRQSSIVNRQTSVSPPGRYITLGGIITTAPDGSEPNIGMYRIQVTGPRSAIFHCHMHHDGARHHRM
ncbi:MAG: UbiD family decarboxylase domain-containing protein, partial [Dehalococcoidia bacterium]